MSTDIVSQFVARYYAVHDTLTPTQQQHTEFSRGQALAYLWGRMDAGETFDPAVSDSFSWAYATVIANFEAGRITSHGPIRDSWECFRQYQEIRDYNGRAIDRVGSKAAV